MPLLLLFAVVLSGCAGGAPPAWPEAAGASGPGQRSGIIPYGDYHVHLLGPYALPLPDPLAPEVSVPAELAELLSARAYLTGRVETEADLDAVFTDEAQLLNAYIAPTGWMHDRYWFMRYLNLWQRDDRRYVPNAYAVDASVGYIAGTVAVGDTHFENFLLTIRRGPEGRWRIASESSTRKTAPRFGTEPITADRLIAELDEAGIQRAVVLSVGNWLGDEASTTRRMIPVADGAEAVRRENDWTVEQVARYPDRLVMACGINPLRDFAIAELVRCSRLPQVIGVKLNFGDSGVSFNESAHVERMREFFAAANAHGMAIIVHLEPGRFYGPAEVELFLDRIAAAAPDITIQIAHLAGNGPDITSPEALEAFAKARLAGDPRAANLWFDFAGLVSADLSPGQAELMATRMRQIGLDRILFGSDAVPGTDANPSAARHWEATRQRLPLSDPELRIIAGNVPPYLR